MGLRYWAGAWAAGFFDFLCFFFAFGLAFFWKVSSSMYMYAWKQGIKTCYYLRSRPATKIAKTTVSSYTPAQAVACSLENPEACEACQ